MLTPDTVYIDIRTCDLTLSQVMAEVARLQSEHPDEEIFLDGDLYAIVGRKRRTPQVQEMHQLAEVGA